MYQAGWQALLVHDLLWSCKVGITHAILRWWNWDSEKLKWFAPRLTSRGKAWPGPHSSCSYHHAPLHQQLSAGHLRIVKVSSLILVPQSQDRHFLTGSFLGEITRYVLLLQKHFCMMLQSSRWQLRGAKELHAMRQSELASSPHCGLILTSSRVYGILWPSMRGCMPPQGFTGSYAFSIQIVIYI